MDTTDECYNTHCKNFVKEDGVEFEYSPDAYGQLGKCKFQRPICNLNNCGMYKKREKKLHVELPLVRMIVEENKNGL